MSINESQFRDLLDRYLQGKSTPEEEKILDEFFNSYKQAESPGNLDLADGEKRDEIFMQMNARISHRRTHRPSGFTQFLKVAAAVGLIAVSYWIYSTQVNNSPVEQKLVPVALVTEHTRKGEKSLLQLPDGTKVHLNSNSSLTYTQAFKTNRSLTLTGEAYFDVTHDADHPFEVTTSSSSVKVLGTSFNIKSAHGKDAEVTLVKGKVSVHSSSDDATLEPGFQAVIGTANNQILTRKVNTERYTSWKDNVIIFQETTLAEASKVLEDWYDTKITIVSPALSNCVITGQYKNESLENVLNSFEFLLKASIDKKDLKNITIKGQGCKTNIN
jgi:transmembrane sensor